MDETREKMQALLDTLDYDFGQFSMTGFIQWLKQRRGREIVRTSYPIPTPTASGAWIAGEDKDFIFYDEATFPFHQAHIQLHEMAHMLCGHPTLKVGRESLSVLFRVVPTAIDLTRLETESLLFLSRYSDEAEREAEMFASLVQKRTLPPLTDKPRTLEKLNQAWVKIKHLQEIVCPSAVITAYCPPTLQDAMIDPDFHIYCAVIAILDATRSLRLSAIGAQEGYLDILSSVQTLDQVPEAICSEHYEGLIAHCLETAKLLQGSRH